MNTARSAIRTPGTLNQECSKLRQVLDCGSLLPLFENAGIPKRQRTGAVQDAVAFARITTAITVILLAFFTLATKVRAEDISAAFSDTNRLYEQQKFSEAAAAYKKLIEQGQISTPLYFNLGNAFFKSGQTGRAIAAYREAERISPRDPDVHANLQFARDQVQNSKQPKTNLWTELLDHLTVNEWAILSSGSLGLWFVLLTVGQWKRDWARPMRGYAIAIAVMACAIIFCTCFAAERRYTETAVVVSPEAVVRRGPFDESQSAFILRDGAELTVVGRKDKWLQVTDTSNRPGWLPDRQVQIISR